jgi:hypothetical protein
MNSVDTFHKRLRHEIAAVEKEIQSHNQQVEALTKHLGGLKRADELFGSDQAAIVELLQTGVADGSDTAAEMANAPAAKAQKRRPAQTQPPRANSSGAILRLAVDRRRQDATLALRARTEASPASTL